MPSPNKEMSEKQLLEQVVQRLDKLILVTTLQGRPKEEQVKYLDSLGYSNSEMAIMLATPKGTIDTIRAKIRKGARGK